MKITQTVTGHSGVEYRFEYEDCDDFSILPSEQVRQAYGVCFYGDQIVLGFGGRKNAWGLIGGTVEKGETFLQTFAREIQEESNMKVLTVIPIGYQKMIDTRDDSFVYQLRYAAKVEPYGPFVSDPAGSITKIALIDPKDYKQYFDWGKVMERIMERAIELRSKL